MKSSEFQSLKYTMEQLFLKLSSSLAKFGVVSFFFLFIFFYLFSVRKSETEHLMLIQIDLNDKNFKQSSVFPVKQFILHGPGAWWELYMIDPHFSFRMTSEVIIRLP